jgi:hypothetical protein
MITTVLRRVSRGGRGSRVSRVSRVVRISRVSRVSRVSRASRITFCRVQGRLPELPAPCLAVPYPFRGNRLHKKTALVNEGVW